MTAVIGPKKEDGPVDEQSDEWWSTPEGERVKIKCVVSLSFLLIRLYLPVHLSDCLQTQYNQCRSHSSEDCGVTSGEASFGTCFRRNTPCFRVRCSRCDTTVAFCTLSLDCACAMDPVQHFTEQSSVLIAPAVITFMVGQGVAQS